MRRRTKALGQVTPTQRKTRSIGPRRRITPLTAGGGRAQPTSCGAETEAPAEAEGPAPREAGPPPATAAAADPKEPGQKFVPGR